MLKFKPDRIILGCTHYPYLINVLSEFAPRDMFIDPAVYFAEYIKNDLEKNHLLENSKSVEEIYVSSSPENFKQSAKMFYDIKELPQLALND